MKWHLISYLVSLSLFVVCINDASSTIDETKHEMQVAACFAAKENIKRAAPHCINE